MLLFKLYDGLKFYYAFIISGFSNGGSWKIEKITELNSLETRKIQVRNKSTYEEIFGYKERASQQ
jgi:hypothetical protein